MKLEHSTEEAPLPQGEVEREMWTLKNKTKHKKVYDNVLIIVSPGISWDPSHLA